MIATLAGLAALAGVIILILALVGAIATGLWVLGVILLVVGGVVWYVLTHLSGRTTATL